MYTHTPIAPFRLLALTLIVVVSLLSSSCVPMPDISAAEFELNKDAKDNNYLKGSQ